MMLAPAMDYIAQKLPEGKDLVSLTAVTWEPHRTVPCPERQPADDGLDGCSTRFLHNCPEYLQLQPPFLFLSRTPLTASSLCPRAWGGGEHPALHTCTSPGRFAAVSQVSLITKEGNSQSEKGAGQKLSGDFCGSHRQLDNSSTFRPQSFRKTPRLRDAPSFESFGWSWCFHLCYLPVSLCFRAGGRELSGNAHFLLSLGSGTLRQNTEEKPTVLPKSGSVLFSHLYI